MTWTRLALGTSVLASLVLGPAIYYTHDRAQVRTEDIVELLEAIAERRLALATNIVTNTVVWSTPEWTPVEGGSYLQLAGWSTITNTFVSSNQYFREWVAITSQVGRTSEPIYRQYAVDGITVSGEDYDIYDGVYSFASMSTNTAGVLEYRFTNGINSYRLAAVSQDPLNTWLFGDGEWLEFAIRRDDPAGGGMNGATWRWNELGYVVSVNISPVGASIVAPADYPARSITNVPNAVSIYNHKAVLEAVDAHIGGMLSSYVDLSRASNGTFVTWFADPDHTNATSFPRLSLARAFELVGPTAGTNGQWLNYPAHGTNAATYGDTVNVVSLAALTARHQVLALMVATEQQAAWWDGEETLTTNNPAQNGNVHSGWRTFATNVVAAAADSNIVSQALVDLWSEGSTIYLNLEPFGTIVEPKTNLNPRFETWYEATYYGGGLFGYSHHWTNGAFDASGSWFGYANAMFFEKNRSATLKKAANVLAYPVDIQFYGRAVSYTYEVVTNMPGWSDMNTNRWEYMPLVLLDSQTVSGNSIVISSPVYPPYLDLTQYGGIYPAYVLSTESEEWTGETNDLWYTRSRYYGPFGGSIEGDPERAIQVNAISYVLKGPVLMKWQFQHCTNSVP